MYLDEIVAAQSRGEVRGIASVCSAHPWVLKAAMREAVGPLLIEATCNQVNQFGGYTGMTPAEFVCYVRGIAEENNFPFESVILGGDHLGPSVWQDEPAEHAMQKAEALVRAYVRAGFVKIHLDCSMPLAGDPPGALAIETSARRAAYLANAAESAAAELLSAPRYVIGSEVPVPGGAHAHEDHVQVTQVKSARQTIAVTHAAFHREGLQSAWERVIGLVVQPGVEFGHDFILDYRPEAARELSRFIEGQPMVYEAHSTDYQTREALASLVRDHFAILKVGPALTFAFREAVFALVGVEGALLSPENHSGLMDVIEAVMVQHQEHWLKHYQGTPGQQAFARKFSLSDRIRYYWQEPRVQSSLQLLINNLTGINIPLSLISQYFPQQYEKIRRREIENTPDALITDKIISVLKNYPA